MSLKSYLITEQNENGWKQTKGIARHKKFKKKKWVKLIRKSKEKVGFKGYEY